jgi:glycerophosphoryl diester phosphodiesterase
MEILAHRGASADAPENTLAAFREAMAQGADGVELDVRLCASGEVVVCHDPTLERLAGVPWEVRYTSWWKLRRADVGTRLGFAPEAIPQLGDVLALLPSRILVNVELKCETADDGELVARTLEVIRSAEAEERVLVSSFNPLCLIRVAALAPWVRRGYLIDPDKPFLVHGALVPPWVSNFSVHPHHTEATAARVRRWKDGGYRVAVWTVDDPHEARRLEALGVDYLITNRPAEMRQALRSRGPP